MKNLKIHYYLNENVQTYKNPFQVELLAHSSNWNQNISVHENISVEKYHLGSCRLNVHRLRYKPPTPTVIAKRHYNERSNHIY